MRNAEMEIAEYLIYIFSTVHIPTSEFLKPSSPCLILKTQNS